MAFERQFGHRLRVQRWVWVVAGVVVLCWLGVSFVVAGGRLLFGLLLWLTCLIAGHNGCAPFAQERDQGGWEELALLPLSERELALGKIAPGISAWLLPLGATALSWCMAALRPAGAGVDWWCWGAVSLLLLPPSYAALGALLGLVSPTSDEAHWRLALITTGLPALLGTGALFGLQLIGAEAICPLFTALRSAGTATFGLAAWVGTLLYAVAGGVAAWLVSTRLRSWALQGAVG
jgi:hypothetical protein